MHFKSYQICHCLILKLSIDKEVNCITDVNSKLLKNWNKVTDIYSILMKILIIYYMLA